MANPPASVKQLNRVALRFAGHPWFPLWAVLRHRGRKSGKLYSTPIAVIHTDTTFLIGMPWGRDSDWVRNVRAAGGCTVHWKGRDFECSDPTFVGKDVALAAARGVARRGLQRANFPAGFLQLQRPPGP